MLLVVRFPKEQWKKVNISRFLSKFEKIRASTVIDVPEKEPNLLTLSEIEKECKDFLFGH